MFCRLCSLLFAAGTLVAADVSGDWELASTYLGDVSYAHVTLKIEGGKLTGSLNELKLEGSIKDGELTFSATRPNGDHFGDFTGKAYGDKLEGTAVRSGDSKITWSAKRAAIPPHTPQVHDFEPTEFHRVFSDAIAPVLHIFPGDTVAPGPWMRAGSIARACGALWAATRKPGLSISKGPFRATLS